MVLSRIGLLFIIIAWIIQLKHSRNGKKDIQKGFLVAQGFGILFLVIAGFAGGSNTLATLNLISFLGVVFVYSQTKK